MTQVERLVKIYLTSRERLLKDIEKRLLWGRNARDQQALVALIDAELKKLNLEAFAWTREAVESAYTQGARLAWQAAQSAGIGVQAFGSFGGLHKRAIDLLAANTQDYLSITNNLIARQARDAVRKIGVEVAARKFAETLTMRETRRLMMARLSEENFFSVPWRNGRGSMRVDSYAELVARTTTAEATNTGTLNQMGEMGQVTVKMTAHNTTCKVCAPRQGRVYRTVDESSLPEGDPRRQLPHISLGLPRWPAYKTIHPNCAHRILAYVWGQKGEEELDKTLKEAKKPFDLDPRGEAERKRYEDAQRKNAERLRDRKQWEKYRDVLGDGAPKTLSGFRAMKRSGNENWQNMSSDYRHALKVMRKDDIIVSKFSSSLPVTGNPASIKDLVREDGLVKQRRYYGPEGRPHKDLDLSDHGNRKRHPAVPHAHDWAEGIRSNDGRPWTEAEKRQNRDLLGGDENV